MLRYEYFWGLNGALRYTTDCREHNGAQRYTTQFDFGALILIGLDLLFYGLFMRAFILMGSIIFLDFMKAFIIIGSLILLDFSR